MSIVIRYFNLLIQNYRLNSKLIPPSLCGKFVTFFFICVNPVNVNFLWKIDEASSPAPPNVVVHLLCNFFEEIVKRKPIQFHPQHVHYSAEKPKH